MLTTYHLEMLNEEELHFKELPDSAQLMEIAQNQPGFNKALYQIVGGDWEWTDKLNNSDPQWRSYVERDELRTWVAYSEGAIAGYFELELQNHDVEIKYFGLTKEFIGKGLGRGLLSAAIQQAWNWQDTKRVWVHTCSLDHPNALSNYQRCGFKVFKTVKED